MLGYRALVSCAPPAAPGASTIQARYASMTTGRLKPIQSSTTQLAATTETNEEKGPPATEAT